MSFGNRIRVNKMKRVYFIVLSIALVILAAASAYSYFYRYTTAKPYGCYYKTDYEIPATLNDLSNVSWHPVGHTGFVNHVADGQVYEPEEVTIINISGETCTIVKEFESVGKTYADGVPLVDLSYDSDLVEEAKKTDNHFQIDIYHGSSVTVDYGNGDTKFYSVPYGEDYPDECLRHKEQINVYFPIIFCFDIAFVVINSILGIAILINSKRKKSTITLCVTAAVLNVIILIFPVYYLLHCLIK